ncbi:MAG: hypothetical protein G01um10147_387 [Microgenomates group bacterium Gr01-1014_7]|nr:MAG: hypothetical protein G01um10147_387 [Microgenomates group bacterium Gr01-1014_7]
MDRTLFLVFGLFCYSLGIIFSRIILPKILTSKTLRLLLSYCLDFFKANSDRVLIFTAVLIIASFTIFAIEFLLPKKFIQTADLIQILIFLATFFTLFYSVLIKDNPTKYRDRPILDIEFKENEKDNYHSTIMNIAAQYIQNNTSYVIQEFVPTYYIRLKIWNRGKVTLENVEVVVEKTKTKVPLQRPFLPLNLHWAFGEAGSERVIRIPQETFRTLDLFEVPEPQKISDYADKLLPLNPLDGTRYREFSKGFRTCSIKPNTFSDIYPNGEYEFYLSIFADNISPKFAKVSIKYNGIWTSDENKMRTQNLKVKLMKSSNNKEEIFDEV